MTTNLRTNNRFQDLDGLAIGGINFPADFRDVNRKYLYFSSNEGMVWKNSGVDLSNNLDGSLSYIIENTQLGTGVNTLRPQTNQYLMIGGSNYNGSLITGGSDRKGTGLSGDIKGQLLIGLTKDDVSSSSSNDNYGSSMTSHISLSHKEIRIIDDKERDNNKYYPSYDGGLILNTEGIYKRQSNHWTKLSDTSEVLKSKVIKAPYLHGDIKYSDMKTNIYQGFNAGTTSNILDRVNKEEGKTSQPSILMYKDDLTSNSSNNNYYDYNMVFLDPILNKNEEYKNWKFSINTNSNNILFEGTIDQNQSATLTEDFDNYIINLNNNITPNTIPSSSRSYHLSSVEGSYKGFFLKVSIPAGDETVDYYFKIRNYDSTNKAVYISKEGIKKDDINDIITTVQTASSSNDRTKLRVLPSEKLTKTISDSIILDGKIKGELYSVSSPSSWPTNIYQKEDYNYLISFGFMKFLSSENYTAPDSSIIDWGNNSNFYHGWNIELLNPYQKGIIQYHGSINQASSESSPQDIPSRRYYSDSIISVNSGKDELYGILTSDGLTSEHSTKDNTNPLIQNYYTGWTIELKNENVSPYYIKTIVYTSTSTNGVGTTITLKDTTPLLTGGSKYILTPPSITGSLLHVNNDSNGDPIFKLEPPYSNISNFYQGWTIKCGNKISVIDTDSTIGSLNSGTAMGFKNTSGLYKWNSSNDNEEHFKNILHNDNQIPFGIFFSSSGSLINTNHYRNTDPDYYNGWTLKTVNPYTETTIGTYDVSSGSSFSLLSPSLPTGTENSEFFIMPPEYTGWIQFNSSSNNCIIEIPDNLVYSHKPELSNITIDFFKGWNIELTHYYTNTREIDPPTTHETITHGNNTAITKDTESWIVDQYKGQIIFIDTNGSRETRVIVSNTNNTITFDKPLLTAPVTGTGNDTTFIIYSEINEEYNVNIKHQRSYIQNSSISSSNKIELTCPELNIDITDEEIISFVLTPKTKYELYPPLRKNSGFMELESKTHLDLKKPSSKYILTPHKKGVFSKGNFENNNISAPRLSNEASMVDHFYKGWTIKTKNPDDFGVITSYTGATREIDIESNRNEGQKITNNTSYELSPHTEGIFRAQGKLSFYASPFKDYYKNWKIVTRTPQNSGSTKINRRVASIIGYDGNVNGSFSGQITTYPNINQFTSTLTTYVLYPPKVIEVPDISVNTDINYTLEPPNFNSYDNHVEKGEIFSFNDSDDSIIHKKILDKNSKYLLDSFYNNWNISCGNISGKIINYDNNTRSIVSSIEEYEEKGKMISNKILDPLASQQENYYNNWKILITEGKNKGREAKIIKYNGVERKIETLPEEFYTDNTSEYTLYPLYHNKNDINTYDETTITKNEGNSYIIYPSEHLYGVLDGTSGTFGTSNYRIILGRNSLRINDYYVGWRIIITTDGFTDVSLIKSYNSLTREIEAENLTKEVNSRSSYYLTKDKHVIGQMRTPIREVKEFELDGSGSTYEDYKVTLRNDDENKDKTGYYEGWDAYLIYTGTTGKEHHFKTEVSYHNYNGEIGLPGVFGITQTEFKITLVEKQKITLSDDAFPIDDYYKGWTINATTDGVTQSSIITEYDGITKVIKAPGLTNVTTVSTIYTLVEPTEGTIIRNNDLNGNNTSSTNTLVLPSFFNNKEKYYKNWLIEINSSRVLILDYEINNTTKVKTVTLASSITPPSDGWANTKFKLLTPDANYNIGIGYQSDLYRTDGNNNISIGKFSGPLVTQGSEDDKLYIDSSNAPRGNYSFIYGDMFNCSLSLNSDVTISNNSENSTGTLTVTGITSITDNTSSSNTSSGALIVTGGVGIGENLNVGGNTVLTGTLQSNNTITVGVDGTGHDVKFYGATSGAYMLWDQSDDDLKLVNSGLIQSGSGLTNTLTGATTITNTTSSTNSSSGALVVTGGVGIGENLNIEGNTVLTGTLQANNTVTVGVNGTGYDVKFYGDTSGAYILWDKSDDDLKLVNSGLIQSGSESNTLTGQTTITNTVTVGVDGTGHDVQFYGATAGAHMLWDQSDDDLKLVNSGLVQSGSSSNTLTGPTSLTDNTSSSNTSSGALIVTGGVGIGENLNIEGNTVLTGTLQANNTITVGANGTGYNVLFYGATSGAYMIWDKSNDSLELENSVLVQNGSNLSNTLTGTTSINNTTNSTNSSSGALVVTGGVGIGENLNIGGNTVLTGTLQANNTVTVGVNGTGYDVKFYGDTTGAYILWDKSDDDLKLVNSGLIQSGSESNTLTGPTTITNTVTVGEEDSGHDVKFYGDTTGAYMLWDESVDDLKLVNSGLVQSGTSSNTLTGPTTITNTVTVGEDDSGHDVQFYGATSGAHMLWDQSEDDLKLVNSGLIQSGTSSNTLTGPTTISNNTASNDSSSGALIVTGGVGIGGHLNVGGNLTVSGITTTVNSNEVNIGDSILLLNSNENGEPSQNGGIEIERGTLDNTIFQWNETSDKWEAVVGSGYSSIRGKYLEAFDGTNSSGLKLYDANNYVVTVSVPPLNGNYNFVLPNSGGSSGEILSTDGNGNLSWINNYGFTVVGGNAENKTENILFGKGIILDRYNHSGAINNIIIGHESGNYQSDGNSYNFKGNTIIGNKSGRNMNGNAFFYNTVLGDKALGGDWSSSNYLTGTIQQIASKNTIIGANAAALGDSLDENVIIGYEAGYNLARLGTYNVFMGNEAGKNIRGGASISSSNNICIGRGSGPDTITSSHPSFIIGGDTNQPIPISGRLYIDTGIRATYRGGESLLYGIQSSDSETSDTLSLNANVTINNLTGSDGTLTVTGTTYLHDNLYIKDSNNNTKITLTSSNGNATFSGSATFSGAVYVNSIQGSNDHTTGALYVAGGVGIGENLNVGGSTILTGTTTINGGTNINGTTNIDASLYIRDSNNDNKFFVDHTNGNTTIEGDLSINSGTTGTNENTGALTVTGDVGINGNIRLPGITTDGSAMNFGGGYVGGGITIYKNGGILSLRNSIRFYETDGSGQDGYVKLKAPDSWTQSSHGVPEYTLTLPLAIDTLVGKGTEDILTNKTISEGTFTGISVFNDPLESKNSDSSFSGLIKFFHPNNTSWTVLYGSKNTNHSNGYIALPEGSSSSTSPYILATTTSSQTLENKEISSPTITGLINLAGGTRIPGNVIAVNSAGTGLEWVTAYTESGLIEHDTSDYNMWGGHGQINPPSSSAEYNILIGQVEDATSNNQRSSTFTGKYNTSVGQKAFKLSATSCNDNSAFGYRALEDITSGDNNVAVGSGALMNITQQLNNTSLGFEAGRLNGYDNIGGDNNTFIGASSGYNIRSNNNTLIGYNTGRFISSNADNDYNICIGANTGPNTLLGSKNSLYIDASGTDTDGLGENSLIYGNQSGTQGNSKQQYLRINGNLEIKKTTYDATTNPYQGTKPGQINLDGCLVFEESGANPSLAISVKNNTNNIYDVFTFTRNGKISKNIEFDDSQERSIRMVSSSNVTQYVDTIKIHTTGRISDMKLGRVPNEGGVGVGPTSVYNTLKWDGVDDSNGSIKWGSGSTGDGFNLSGGSSTSSDDTRNIHFGSGITSNNFDTQNERNIIIGHYAGGDLRGSDNSDDNIAIGYKSFKVTGSNAKKGNVAIGPYTLGGNGNGTDTTPEYNVAIGPEALSKNSTGDGNICIGYQSGKDLTTGNHNVLIGRETGLNLAGQKYRNVLLGHKAGNNLNSNRNICIGDGTGFTSSSSTSGHIIIETGWGSGDTDVTRGLNSFIYGKQNGGSGDDTLSLNANVTINNLNSTSSGNLTVTGDLNASGSANFNILNTGGTANLNGTSNLNTTNFNNRINFNSGTASNRRILIEDDAGTSGYVLTSGGSSGSITWSAPSGGLSLSGGSSTSDDDTRNIHFGSGISSNYFDTANERNIIIGHYAGGDLTAADDSDDNIIIGYKSFKVADAGTTAKRSNIAIGSYTLGGNAVLTGTNAHPYYNVAIGTEALSRNTSGDSNICIGYQSGHQLTTGAENVLIGGYSGPNLSEGKDSNIFIGHQSGKNLNSNKNICIGGGAGFTASTTTECHIIIESGVGWLNRGENSFIYGKQGSSSSLTNDTLSLNADVTINNQDSNSNGNLTVKGEFNNPGIGGGANPNSGASFGNANFALIERSNNARLYNWKPTSNRIIITDTAGNLSTATYAQVCFLPGTKVTLSNKKTIDIDDIKEGDKVLSYKFDDMEPLEESIDVLSWFSYDDSGNFSESVVSKIWKTTSMGGHVTLNNKLRVTHEHNIFVKIYQGEDNDKKEDYEDYEDYEEDYKEEGYEEEDYEEGDYEYSWIPAKEVKIGDYIFTDKGEYEEVTEVSEDEDPVNVYNMKVKSDSMNYFTDTYLVHNASPCDECSQTTKL